MNYNAEIYSFVNANKNRTGKVSFEKLKNNFGTEIGPKIVFHTIYEKRYFLCFLAMAFLIETLLPFGRRTGNLKMGSFYATPLKTVRPLLFQTAKFRWFLTFLQNFLLLTQKKRKCCFNEYKTIQS